MEHIKINNILPPFPNVRCFGNFKIGYKNNLYYGVQVIFDYIRLIISRINYDAMHLAHILLKHGVESLQHKYNN
jgi:hypothetical protein